MIYELKSRLANARFLVPIRERGVKDEEIYQKYSLVNLPDVQIIKEKETDVRQMIRA
jgi:hypothetical protein